MNRMTERKRLRREYLQQKVAGEGIIISATMLFSLLFIITLLLGFATIAAFVISCCYRSLEGAGWSLGVAAVTACSGFLTWMSLRLADKGDKMAGIPYVPPVTASTLPAEEILVRAADEPPVAQSEVLLRAAQKGQETVKEELLRGSRGE